MNSIHVDRMLVLKNSAVYAGAAAVGNSYALLSVPLLTRNLAADQWAQFSLILVFSRIYNLATTGLFSQGFIRMYVDKSPREQRQFVGAIVIALAAISLLGFVAVLLSGRFAIPWLLPAVGALSEKQALLIAAWLAISPFRPFCLSLIKITEQVRYLAVVNLLYGVGYLGSIGIGVVGLGRGMDAALLSLAVGEVTALAGTTRFLLRHFVLPPSLRPAWDCLRFTMPLLVGSALFVLFTQVDRFVLARLATVGEISAYSVGAMVALLPATLVSSLIAPATARVLRVHAEGGLETALRLTRQVMTDQISIAVLACGTLLLVSMPILIFVGGPFGRDPIAAAALVALTCGHLTRLVYLFVQNTLFCLKRRHSIMILNVVLLMAGLGSALLLDRAAGPAVVGWYFAASYGIVLAAAGWLRLADFHLPLPVTPILSAILVMGTAAAELAIDRTKPGASSQLLASKGILVLMLGVMAAIMIARRKRKPARS